MKRRRTVTAMGRHRAERFPKPVRLKIMDWNIKPGQVETSNPIEGRRVLPTVEFDLHIPGAKAPIQFATSPDDAYELMTEIGLAIDQALGV